MTDLEKRLAEGVAAARTLSYETDRLTEELAQVERALDELKLGVSARVPISNDRHLCFEKEGKIWRLLIRTGDKTLLLINASRGLRLEAVGHLNALVLAMVDESERQVGEVRAAHDRTTDYLAKLREFINRNP